MVVEGNCSLPNKYILDLFVEIGTLGCHYVPRLLVEITKLVSRQEIMLIETYQWLVGRLMYFCHTRPNISYPVSVVSRYMHDLRAGNMEAFYRILRYLKETPDKGLWFRKNMHLALEGYCDVN